MQEFNDERIELHLLVLDDELAFDLDEHMAGAVRRFRWWWLRWHQPHREKRPRGRLVASLVV